MAALTCSGDVGQHGPPRLRRDAGGYLDRPIRRDLGAGRVPLTPMAAARAPVPASQQVTAVGPELVLVNTFGPQSWEHQVTAALGAAVRHGKNVQLADWDAAIADHTSLLWSDGIHPSPAGANLYAHVVIKAIKTGITPG